MKRIMLMAAIAVLLSAGLTAQNETRRQNQNRAQSGTRARQETQTETQNRSSATIQEQTQNQYRNYGQMTSEQKRARNEERKALRKQQRELRMQERGIKRQEESMNREQYRDQERAAARNQGARRTTPMRNTGRGPGSPGPGRK